VTVSRRMKLILLQVGLKQSELVLEDSKSYQKNVFFSVSTLDTLLGKAKPDRRLRLGSCPCSLFYLSAFVKLLCLCGHFPALILLALGDSCCLFCQSSTPYKVSSNHLQSSLLIKMNYDHHRSPFLTYAVSVLWMWGAVSNVSRPIRLYPSFPMSCS
jgi:hypothetical protein